MFQGLLVGILKIVSQFVCFFFFLKNMAEENIGNWSENIFSFFLTALITLITRETAIGLELTTTCFVNEHSTIWPSNWVFTYELSGPTFESSCSHLNFRYRACFEQGVLDIQANIECRFTLKMRTWLDKKIQSSRIFLTLSGWENVFSWIYHIYFS